MVCWMGSGGVAFCGVCHQVWVSPWLRFLRYRSGHKSVHERARLRFVPKQDMRSILYSQTGTKYSFSKIRTETPGRLVLGWFRMDIDQLQSGRSGISSTRRHKTCVGLQSQDDKGMAIGRLCWERLWSFRWQQFFIVAQIIPEIIMEVANRHPIIFLSQRPAKASE